MLFKKKNYKFDTALTFSEKTPKSLYSVTIFKQLIYTCTSNFHKNGKNTIV